jgi:regulator of replication initiation timing
MNTPVNNVSDLEKKATLLMKQKRSEGTGCTLNASNVALLAANWSAIINQQALVQWQPILNDKSGLSLVLCEHDFELFKAARNLVQTINSVHKMIEARITEINKLIEDNKELFDALNKEYEDKIAAEKLEEQQKKVAGITCEDEGCPQYGTAHSHVERVAGSPESLPLPPALDAAANAESVVVSNDAAGNVVLDITTKKDIPPEAA